MKSIHSPLYHQVIRALVTARRKAGLSQENVAQYLGKPQSYVAKVENTERRLDIIEFLAFAQAVALNYGPLLKAVAAQLEK